MIHVTTTGLERCTGVEHEADLLARLRRGEQGAFDEVYAAYRARLYAFLLRLCDRRDVADDLFQETFTKLAIHAGELRDDSDLAAWLFTVARNAYRSHRRWAILDLSRFVFGSEPLEHAEAQGADPEVAAASTRTMQHLERALGTLTPAAREALLLVAIEGFEQERAAAIVGVSYAAFRQRLTRARADLAAALESP